MAINLVSREDRDLKKMVRLANWVKTITTLVLVGYIASVVGLSGWWISVFDREQRQTSEETLLAEEKFPIWAAMLKTEAKNVGLALEQFLVN